MLNAMADPTIELRCGNVPLLTGRMGRQGSNIAVLVENTKFEKSEDKAKDAGDVA